MEQRESSIEAIGPRSVKVFFGLQCNDDRWQDLKASCVVCWKKKISATHRVNRFMEQEEVCAVEQGRANGKAMPVIVGGVT